MLVPKADWNPKFKENKEEIKDIVIESDKEPKDIVIESDKRNIAEESKKLPKEVKEKTIKENSCNEKTPKKEQQKFLELNESRAEYQVEPQILPQISKEIKNRDTFFKNYKIIGQIFNTYWLIEQNQSIFMIDQHAAHERVLYEELMEELKKQKVTAQMLLQPLLLKLTEKEKQVLQDNMELLYQFGFSIEVIAQKEQKTYALLSVPFIIKAPTSTKFFLDILDKLEETPIETIYDTKIITIATMACKAAVKGNDRLDIREATALIEKLLQLENPFTCPHGRPTIIEITQYELEKQFKRK